MNPNTMKKAFFINGVFRTVLEEIVAAQQDESGLICYLQPYSAGRMKLLVEEPPSMESPMPLYVSLSDDLGHICYTAEIVGWEDKQELLPDRLEELNRHIKKHQPSEEEIYLTVKGHKCTNLIAVTSMRCIPNLISVSNLIKISDSAPVGTRTRSGGYANVYRLPDWIDTQETAIKSNLDVQFESQVDESLRSNPEDRRSRLVAAPRMPEKVQVLSVAYKRNSDVVVEVLSRARGVCERCSSSAPFIRASNNTPYLEIHHWTPLSAGGEDTVENAGALCPNCHRELHYGLSD